MAVILTLDDEPGIRAFIADVLVDAGHEVSEAADAQSALGQLSDRPFDVTITPPAPGAPGGAHTPA